MKLQGSRGTCHLNKAKTIQCRSHSNFGSKAQTLACFESQMSASIRPSLLENALACLKVARNYTFIGKKTTIGARQDLAFGICELPPSA
mmetsp:Transcript_122507/g.191365  ORF Transcript_122507/g.191365 Transcript_122507/m.191365 type:complete len:89 (-) Transcript_122507:615-881(-)